MDSSPSIPAILVSSMIPSRSLALPSSSSSGVPPYSLPRRTTRCAAAVSLPARGRSATLYEVLGVAAAASGLEIKAAYRRLARTCHPDAVAADRKRASADDFMRVHAAYETLSDPEKRADYDRKLIPAATAALAPENWQPFHSPISHSYAAGCHRSRTWETDQCW